jgi:hypothetical protein
LAAGVTRSDAWIGIGRKLHWQRFDERVRPYVSATKRLFATIARWRDRAGMSNALRKLDRAAVSHPATRAGRSSTLVLSSYGFWLHG